MVGLNSRCELHGVKGEHCSVDAAPGGDVMATFFYGFSRAVPVGREVPMGREVPVGRDNTFKRSFPSDEEKCHQNLYLIFD